MNNRRRFNPTVLFYPTGIVHFRNLEILKKYLPGFRFKIIVEPWVKENAPEILDQMSPDELVEVKKGTVPKEVWNSNVNILFLSMAYPNPFRLRLIYDAMKRNIPVIALEEVNQLALNDGIINHYFLPVDYLGVASGVEKEQFMDLGLTSRSITVTGWPFFNKESVAGAEREIRMRKQYEMATKTKTCLLILGSLKENDMVSLETRAVRNEILRVVSEGLTGTRKVVNLKIKPHPIETPEGIEEIKRQAPGADVLDPKTPIEPLLTEADIVVNRGNSQVTLLALMQFKPVIIVPGGLKTVFHGIMDSVITDSPNQFTNILDEYFKDRLDREAYRRMLTLHFPIENEQALRKVKRLFYNALEGRGRQYRGENPNIAYISILYAFLGNNARAKEIALTLADQQVSQRLIKLYNRSIQPEDFDALLEKFPGKMVRWHLQALFIRSVSVCLKRQCILEQSVQLLKGFDGDVNPHYFMEDIVKRIELEYRSGNDEQAAALVKKFYNDYSIYDFYKQAFDMLDFVYKKHKGNARFWKLLWLMTHIGKGHSRKYIKEKLKRL
jgi:hypothetical protein